MADDAMTVCLTELGRSWLAPWQQGLAYARAEISSAQGRVPWRQIEMFKLFFPAQGMTLWVTRNEFRRSH